MNTALRVFRLLVALPFWVVALFLLTVAFYFLRLTALVDGRTTAAEVIGRLFH